MGKIIIHVNGLDRIGIVSDISKEINKLSGNIETSKMVKLGRDFNMLLLISIKKENIKLLENKLLSYDDLSVTLKQTANEKSIELQKLIKITIKELWINDLVDLYNLLKNDKNIHM